MYSHDQLYKHKCICMQNHYDNTIKTSDTVLRKIYLSLNLKGLCVRGSWRPNRTATFWPRLLWPSAFLSRSPGLLNRGPGGLASLCAGFLYCILSPTPLIPNWMNFLCTELYNSSTFTFLWTSQIALIQPVHGQGYILIFLERMHLLFTQVHFLFWQLGRVVGQYTTLLYWLVLFPTEYSVLGTKDIKFK